MRCSPLPTKSSLVLPVLSATTTMKNANVNTRMSSSASAFAFAFAFAAYCTVPGNPISIESSGLDAITFATLIDEHGLQVKCPGGCMAPVTRELTHHCMTCGHSFHCAILCGQDYAQWFEKYIKIGFNSFMLPPHSQSKLAQFNSIPPNCQAICNYCIQFIESKMATKQPSGGLSTTTRQISPTSSLLLDTTKDDEDGIDDVGAIVSHFQLPSLLPLTQYFHDGKQTLCVAAGICKHPGGYDLPSISIQSLCILCDLAMHKNAE